MDLSHSNSTSEASPEVLDATAADLPNQRNFSCVLCSQRKVKCDRRPRGCNNCTKVQAACIYKAPLPPRRRKKGVRDVDTITRLRLCEDALRQLGVDPEELIRQDAQRRSDPGSVSGINDFLEPHMPTPTRKTRLPSEAGVLVFEEGRSRYLENGIWTSLKAEFRETKEILEESSSDDETHQTSDGASPAVLNMNSASLLFGSQTPSAKLRSLHPDPIQIFKLWQSYLGNINPLVKVLHTPTVQQLISNISGNMDDLPRDVEALLFAIYCITAESLSDGECIIIMGESKSVVIQRFRLGAQQALINTSVLRTSNLMVLQAFTLFILSLQNYDARVIWIFSGIAQRIGQRIGLHRDGEALELPPFDIEMRRRLWWQIMMLEGFSQKLAGTGTSGTILMGDVKMPSNVNDSDLFPGMKTMPSEHKGATEMMFFLIRCLVGEFLKRSADSHTTFDGVWHRLTQSSVKPAIKDKAITELEALFERRYLQYCDPSVTWHLMCTQLAKNIIFMMRFMTHSTDYYTADMPQAEKDVLFDIALQVATSQNLAYTMKGMQGFMWHVNLHFQWKAFIFILSELRTRTEGTKVDAAWQEIEKSYDYHPSFDKELSVRALPVAVSNLTLKAWDAYVLARGKPQDGEPYFIQLIRQRQERSRRTKSSKLHLNAAVAPPSVAPTSQGDKDTLGDSNLSTGDPLQVFEWNTADLNASMGVTPTLFDSLPLDYPEEMNWSSWENLVIDFQTYDATEFPTDLSAFDFGMQ